MIVTQLLVRECLVFFRDNNNFICEKRFEINSVISLRFSFTFNDVEADVDLLLASTF